MVFLLHQCLSTIVVIVGSGFIVFSIISVLHHLQPEMSNKTASLILTTIPGFPVQTMIGMLLGGCLMKNTGHRAALWVWVAPAITMLILLMHGPVAEYGIHGSANVFSHFFGNGCKPGDRCLDQIVFTLPLCTTIGYSLGAAFARPQKKAAMTFSAASS
jgi:predicted MFS family arabinose efflux permease